MAREKGIGQYDHMNKTHPISLDGGLLVSDIDALARSIIDANYGMHRILSALVRAREASPKSKQLQDDELLRELKSLLDRGLS